MAGNTIPAAPNTVGHRWRFALVLTATLLLVVAQPLLSGLFDQQGSFDVFFSLLIAAVLLLVFEERKHRLVAVLLALATFLGVWVSYAVGGLAGRVILVAAHLIAVCFIALALSMILRAVFVKQVSGDAVFGVVCGYLLLGIIWTLLYAAVDTAFPGSFHVSTSGLARDVAAQPDRSVLGYYSFITLATVGYGDVTPATPLARTLAWMEAVTGQFYLAVLVAGLVGLKVTQAMRSQSDNEKQHK
jgi:voltage-gated potassium channel